MVDWHWWECNINMLIVEQTNKQTKNYLSRHTCYTTAVYGASGLMCPLVTGVLYLEDEAICNGGRLLFETVVSSLFVHVCPVETAQWVCNGERLLLDAMLSSLHMQVMLLVEAKLSILFIRVCIAETAYGIEYLVTRLRLKIVFSCLAANILGTKSNILQRSGIKI